MRQLAEFMDYVPLDDVASGVKVKSIFSFTISPDMKQQGTASAMLEQVRSDAENVRIEFVEAYPYKESVFMSSDFISIKSKKVKVMRKTIKKPLGVSPAVWFYIKLIGQSTMHLSATVGRRFNTLSVVLRAAARLSGVILSGRGTLVFEPV